MQRCNSVGMFLCGIMRVKFYDIIITYLPISLGKYLFNMNMNGISINNTTIKESKQVIVGDTMTW